MLIKRALVLTALLVPLTALALEIRPADFYTDVRAGSHEAAGINLLTREGIVQGYGEGRFGPARLINRAEFLKIAILASPDAYDVITATGGCFPDVKPGDWFAPYVCTAKAAGIVSGNARSGLPQDQWTFNPEAPVTYDAALKMLVLLFRHPIPNVAGNDWAEPYYQAAVAKGVDLPIRITFDTRLTRGMSARLAGAFLAESEGKIAEYRLAEAGEYSSSASSSVSSSASSSVSSSVSSSSPASSSSSSSVASLFTLPSVSHFLVVGTVTDAIADGIIRSNNETARIAIVQVKLYQEVRSIDRLELLTSSGQFIANLKRRTTTDITDYAQTFDAQIQPEQQVTIPRDTDVRLVLRAVIRNVNNAGFSDELLQVRTFSVTIKGDTTNESINLPINGPFPKHQTSFGRITSIKSSRSETSFQSGTDVLIDSYSFNGSVIAGKNLALRQLIFSFIKNSSTTVTAWILVHPASGARVACAVNEQEMTISCPLLNQGLGVLNGDTPLLFDLKATLVLPNGTQDSILHTWLDAAGSPESFGSIEWTDESGIFRWVD